MSERCFTLDEVAARLDVAVETVKVWIRSGELRGINKSRKPDSQRPRYVVDAGDLAAFERGRASKTETPKPKQRWKRPAEWAEIY